MKAALGSWAIPGHAPGKDTVIHVDLDDGDWEREFGTMPGAKIAEANGSAAVTAMKRGLQNRGVDIMSRETFLVSGLHSELDIDKTLEAFKDTMAAVRADGLI
ncbi:MAG: hypothetical protein H8E48_04425 [Chloroflexi bacterium]|nr:hypothetical protein [Chloroflexota bacterium]